MRKMILLFALLLISVAETDKLVNIKPPETVLRLGEKFTFTASVLGFTPEINIYLWTDSLFCEINGDSCYHFTFYMKINHSLIPIRESKIESYARTTDLVTVREEQYLLEKNKEKWQIINFNPEKGTAYYEKDSTIFFDDQSTIDSSGIMVKSYVGIHDMINIFWYLRLIDVDSMAIGDTFYIWSFAENRKVSYRLPVVFLREEKIKVPAGTFSYRVFNCCVRRSKIFSANSGDITLWIDKDKRIIAQATRKEKALGIWQTVIFKLKAIE
ncbi:MAG: DUF3108 domain-containing protein [Patescibacteria group bacterium]